jgi:hypothetical protein
MKFIENAQIAAGFGPVDMQTAANDGAWVTMKDWEHLTIVLFKAAGTAGDDPTLALQQATSLAGAGAKDLLIDRIYVKQGTLPAVDRFTEVAISPPAASYTDLVSAEIAAIWVVELDAEQLDSDGGFSCVRARVADVGGNAQLGCLWYLGTRGRRVGKVANVASLIS